MQSRDVPPCLAIDDLADAGSPDAVVVRQSRLRNRSREISDYDNVRFVQFRSVMALPAHHRPVAFFVSRVLIGSRPAKMTRVYARQMSVAARMSGFMTRRWRGAVDQLAHDPCRLSCSHMRPAVGETRERPRHAFVADMVFMGVQPSERSATRAYGANGCLGVAEPSPSFVVQFAPSSGERMPATPQNDALHHRTPYFT